VTPTENNAPAAPTSKAGRFALLSNLLSAKGSSASEIGLGARVFSARRAGRTLHPLSRLKCCVPALLCAVLGTLAFTAVPALAAPAIASEATTNETGASATLTATVNPESLPVVSCEFEYGTTVSYGTSVPCEQSSAQIGEGTVPVPVSATLTKLDANTEYHWRLLAGASTSSDHTFNYLTGGEGLPDNRAYEMVTPPFKNGGLVGDVFIGFDPAISEGESAESLHPGPTRVTALDIQCFEPSGSAPTESCDGVRGTNGEPFEFTRTSSGWETTALAPPATQFSENTPWLVSASEGTALFSMPPEPAVAEDDWYARSPTGAFAPVGPATPPESPGIYTFDTLVHASTADLSNVVWQIENPLGISGRYWPFDETTGPESLYEYAGRDNTEPFLVGVSNKGRPEHNSESELISDCETNLGGESQTWNALSGDGSTVYFTADKEGGQECFGSGPTNESLEVPVPELYARVDGEGAGAHTVAISQPEAPETSASTPVDENCAGECAEDISVANEHTDWRSALFVGASEDGSKAFFLDPQKLTNEAVESPGNPEEYQCRNGGEDCNLYLYDFSEPEGHNLIDVSAGSSEPEVQGVVATSADGSHVYFVARGVLTTQERPGCKAEFEAEHVVAEDRCQAQGGADNLYVYERDSQYPEGRTVFVASLSGLDTERDWIKGNAHEANVTPDGGFLVFQSHGHLTPDDTGNEDYSQVFRYDAETGELARVSVGEDGFDGDGNAGVGEATIVGAYVGDEQAGPARGDPTMSNDGSYVFFQSPVQLTPDAPKTDTVIGQNNKSKLPMYAQSVYEWHAGHVYLISDGRDASSANTPCDKTIGEPASKAEVFGSAVCLLGTDATGKNVFFQTADQLVPKDTDTQVDIYDARICESGSPCVSEPPPALPPCDGEDCHGIPAATPSLLAPGTASFNGEGNLAPVAPVSVVKPKSLTKAQKLTNALKACKKDKSKKKRASCEKQARKKYGVIKAKKSTDHKGSK